MRILVKEGDSIVADLMFDRQAVHIGSECACGVHLPDLRLAPRHAALIPCDDGHWHLRPIDPARPTSINGHLSRGEVPIANGDQIIVGDYTLNVYLELGEHASAPPDSEQRRRAERPALPQGTQLKFRRDRITLPAAMVFDSAAFANALGAANEVEEAIEIVLNQLLVRFGAQVAWIGIRRHTSGGLELTRGRTRTGSPFDQPHNAAALQSRCLQLNAGLVGPLADSTGCDSFMAAPLSTLHGPLGLVYVGSDPRSPVLGEADLDHLLVLAAQIAARLEGLYRTGARRRRAVANAELSIMQAVQDKLATQVVPEWPQLQVAVHVIHGSGHAGDLHDVQALPNGAAAMLIGHVHGHSANAAISLIEVRAAFRIAVLHADLPHVLMRELAWLLERQVARSPMSCAVFMVDPRTGGYVFCAAGDVGAVIIGTRGECRVLGAGSPMIGGNQPTNYVTGKGRLVAEETLLMYTPGIAQIADSESLHESAADAFGMSARALLDSVAADLKPADRAIAAPQDITLMAAHRVESA